MIMVMTMVILTIITAMAKAVEVTMAILTITAMAKAATMTIAATSVLTGSHYRTHLAVNEM